MYYCSRCDRKLMIKRITNVTYSFECVYCRKVAFVNLNELPKIRLNLNEGTVTSIEFKKWEKPNNLKYKKSKRNQNQNKQNSESGGENNDTGS